MKSFSAAPCASRSLRACLILLPILTTIFLGVPASLVRAEPSDSISFDGVTFTFAEPRLTGHFIDGYPYVVGAVSITGYDPACRTLPNGRVINGAMINPAPGGKSGFDSIAGKEKWAPELNVGAGLSPANPLLLSPGESLLVAISDPEVAKQKQSIKRMVILTCLAEAPPEDAFRPAFTNAPKVIHRLSQIDTTRLGNLNIVGEAPTAPYVAESLQRFHLDLVPNWDRDHFQLQDHSSGYGRDLCVSEGRGYVLANCDLPPAEKEKILIPLIQRGIDRYGVWTSLGKTGWSADGGHNSGRKFSIMFAGALLGVPEMENVVLQTRYDDSLSSGRFQEDVMSFYVDQAHVDVTNSSEWAPAYGNKRPQQPYAPEMIGMPEWRGNAMIEKTSASWSGHPYRASPNNGSQHGQALAAVVMGLREAWRHDAYFDYHARYLAIMNGAPDPWGTQRKPELRYPPAEGSQPEGGWPQWQRAYHSDWLWTMINTYWDNYYDYPWE